jgi:Peptidase family M28
MKLVTIFISYLFFSSILLSQNKQDSILVKYYQNIIQTLSHDSLQGRPTGTIYEKKSANYIAKQFNNLGLKSKLQVYKFKATDSTSFTRSQNVYCFINNKADSTIIIGAHYDHIGLGGPLSRSMGKKGIHHGADDNASGIALLLGLTKNFKQWNNPKYNYVLVAYSAHEIGLYGSTSFGILAAKKYDIALVINFDMVGRMHPDLNWLKIAGVDTSKVENSFFKTAFKGIHYKFDTDSILLELDTKKYYENKISCISFSTGVHDDYHKITDTENKINYLGMLSIQKMLESYLSNFK